MKIKAKNVRTGRIIEKTYRADEKVTQAIVQRQPKQFLYRDGENFVFMDTGDYSQLEVPGDQIGDRKDFLVEGEEVVLSLYDSDVLDVELPPQVKMKVTEAAPGLKGDSVSGSTKKVKLETGLSLEVPLFINQGESIIVDTRTGAYISRAD